MLPIQMAKKLPISAHPIVHAHSLQDLITRNSTEGLRAYDSGHRRTVCQSVSSLFPYHHYSNVQAPGIHHFGTTQTE